MQLMTDNSTKTLINLTKQIYNGLTQAIQDGDTKEAAERLRQDDVISAKVTAETDARIQADSDEATARQAKDAELQAAIETETSERKSADTILQSNIDKENTARANADTAINNKLDPIISSLNAMYTRMPYSKGQTGVPVEIGHSLFTSQALTEYGAKESTFDDDLLQAFLKKIWVILNEKGYSNYCKPHGLLQPYGIGFFWGLISMFPDSAPKEDKGLPQSSQFYFYYPNTHKTYVFGTYDYTYFKYELADTDTVNTLISNAKTALETAYKNADTQSQTDITTAYQQADTNLSNALTQAYTDADTALKTELEGKINSITANTTGLIETQNIAEAKIMTATVDAYGPQTETVSVIGLSTTEQYAVKTSLSVTTQVNANTPITCPVASNGIIYGMLRNNAYDSVKTKVYPILTIYPQTLTINSDKTAKIEVLKTDRYGREISNIYDKYAQLSISNIKLYK